MPRQILTAVSALEKAEKATRAQLEELNDQIEAGFDKITDDVVDVVNAFRASHAELLAKQAAIRQGLLDRLSEEAQSRINRYEWFKPTRLNANRVSYTSDDLTVTWRPSSLGSSQVDDGPSYNDLPRPTLPPNKNGDEFEYLDGIDAQGNSIPDCLEINSDDVTPKALAELAMAAVRITKRHREAAEDMAGFEETARRVLKRARIEGTIVEPPRDHQQDYNDQWGAWGERAAARVHAQRLHIGYYDRVGPNREQIWHLPKDQRPIWPINMKKPAVPGPPTSQPTTEALSVPQAAVPEPHTVQAAPETNSAPQTAVPELPTIQPAPEAVPVPKTAPKVPRAVLARKPLPAAKPAPARKTTSAPKAARVTKSAPIPKGVPAPKPAGPAPTAAPARPVKIRIGKAKIAAAAAAAAAAPALSFSPAAIPSTSDASASPASSPRAPARRSPSSPRTRLPSTPPPRSPAVASSSLAPVAPPPSSPGFPVIPESPPAPRRQPRRGCRKSTMKLPSSDSEDSD